MRLIVGSMARRNRRLCVNDAGQPRLRAVARMWGSYGIAAGFPGFAAGLAQMSAILASIHS